MLPSVDELKERYSSWSNGRLLSVLLNKEEYTREAVEVARAELGQRNVTTEEVDLFLREQEEQELMSRMLSCVPLKFWEKALFFFFWFTPWFLARAFHMNYSEDGYALKAKQGQVFSVAGFISLLAVAAVTIYFNFSNTVSALLLVCVFLVFCRVERKIEYVI